MGTEFLNTVNEVRGLVVSQSIYKVIKEKFVKSHRC